MEFGMMLQADLTEAARLLGYRGAVDAPTYQKLVAAAEEVEAAVRPAYTFARYPLVWADVPMPTPHISLTSLSGRDIAAHLEGCQACFVLALTLGAEVDALLRAKTAASVEEALLADAAASTLAEQYAQLVWEELAARATRRKKYVTSRFSPGYGDLPLSLQGKLLALLDAGKSIGLTVNRQGLLLPAKSVTALVGIADRPVEGKPAGCATCPLRGRCTPEEPLCGLAGTKQDGPVVGEKESVE